MSEITASDLRTKLPCYSDDVSFSSLWTFKLDKLPCCESYTFLYSLFTLRAPFILKSFPTQRFFVVVGCFLVFFWLQYIFQLFYIIIAKTPSASDYNSSQFPHQVLRTFSQHSALSLVCDTSTTLNLKLPTV